MSEDCHEINNTPTERYYQCTCCGVRDHRPGIRCGCSDNVCGVCKRCMFCCKTPGEHTHIMEMRTAHNSHPGRTEAEDAEAFLRWMDAQHGFPNGRGGVPVLGTIPQVPRHGDFYWNVGDIAWLTDLKISWDGDKR